ncbi:hypothetical protein E4T56_gene18207 [Termitomyces sp. T112]|nr:hypothetical protein E4T56_gene18207 [Termitomyces sp. T112]
MRCLILATIGDLLVPMLNHVTFYTSKLYVLVYIDASWFQPAEDRMGRTAVEQLSIITPRSEAPETRDQEARSASNLRKTENLEDAKIATCNSEFRNRSG